MTIIEKTIEGCRCFCETEAVKVLTPVADSGLKQGLEIGLIVLVAVLVIIGLILGFSKLKREDNEDDEENTYY